MLYLLVFAAAAIFIALLVAKYKEKNSIKKIFGVGSLLTALLIILRIGPLRVLYFFNLLIPFFPFLKNFQVKNNQTSVNNSFTEMSVEEAKEILCVSAEADEKEIKEAYKKLILKNHPDHGGSKYIAEKLNKAKDILLKKKTR